MADLTPKFLSELAYAVHQEVANRRDPVIPDRKAYPFWSFLMGRRGERTYTNGKTTVKLQVNGGLGIQWWDGKDVLAFEENEVNKEMEFAPGRAHSGVEFVHAELEDLGYTVTPNQPRGKAFAKKIAKADADRVMNLFDQKIEDMMDTWDVNLDEQYHLDGTQDPKAPIGLDGLLPLDNTAGSIGGQPRTDPIFQHQARLGLTFGAGGDMERGLQDIIRGAQVNNRGTASRIDVIFAGWDFIDAYIAYAQANGMPYQRNGGIQPVQKLDIGIPDESAHFNGIPIVHDPSYEVLDSKGLYTGTPWSKRAYLLASKTWRMGYQTGKLKNFSAPADPGDQRLTRVSLDGRHSIELWKPNGNGVATIA